MKSSFLFAQAVKIPRIHMQMNRCVNFQILPLYNLEAQVIAALTHQLMGYLCFSLPTLFHIPSLILDE